MKITKKIQSIFVAITLFVATTPLVGAQITNPVIGELGDDAVAAGSGETFGVIVGRILGMIPFIAGLLLFLYLIWAGIEWITSGGDKGKVESARNKITQGVIGMIVLAGGIAIFMLIQTFLGVEILNFESSGGAKDTKIEETAPPRRSR